MRRTIIRFTLIVCSLLGSACTKENPNPELLDPIYDDLSKRAADAQKTYEDELKKQEDTQKQLEHAEPNSIELKQALKDLSKSKEVASHMQQRALYYKIRSERRLLVDRISYKEAFAKSLKWPDPAEFSAYQTNIRLNEASRNWGARVPRLQDRLSKAPPKEEKAKEKAE